jgi:hypothetical protein
MLIRGRLLDAVNNENVDLSSCRFEFETQLLLKSLKERRPYVLRLDPRRLDWIRR